MGNDPCFKVVISLLIVRNLSWILCQTCFLLKPQSQLYAGFDVAGEWSFAFPAHDGIKFAAALRGSCWGRVAGQDAPIRFDEGDCFLVNRGCRFVMASDLALAPDDPPIS